MNLTKKIKQAKKILIVGHVRPDGDCLGAGLALYRLAQKSGTQAELVYDSDLPFHYSFMQYYDCINKASLSDYDLLIIVDCGDRFRMGKYAEFLGKVHSIQFDHHISNDGFADENYVYPYRSSTCEILSEILLDEDAVDSEMATLLYVGLSTDTGHFMHNNVTSAVFSLAAKLMEKGADAYNVNCALYRSRTWEKTKLIGKAIQSMKFFGDGSYLNERKRRLGCISEVVLTAEHRNAPLGAVISAVKRNGDRKGHSEQRVLFGKREKARIGVIRAIVCARGKLRKAVFQCPFFIHRSVTAVRRDRQLAPEHIMVGMRFAYRSARSGLYIRRNDDVVDSRGSAGEGDKAVRAVIYERAVAERVEFAEILGVEIRREYVCAAVVEHPAQLAELHAAQLARFI